MAVADESAFWAQKVKPVIHCPPEYLGWKMISEHGHPDVLYCQDGQEGLVELKYQRTYPVRPTTTIKTQITPNQRNRLDEWIRSRGRGYVLMGICNDWYLFPHSVPDELLRQELTAWALAWGTFKDLFRLRRLLSAPYGELQGL